MKKTKMNLRTLGSIFDSLEPGDVFYLLNDSNRHVVVLIFDVGAINEEGMFIRKDRAIRYPAQNVNKFDLDYRFFESKYFQVNLDGVPGELSVGEVIVIFDRDALDEGYEKIGAEIDVILKVDGERSEYETFGGRRISLDNLNFLPTGVTYTNEGIDSDWK